jgi:hypothetical protein
VPLLQSMAHDVVFLSDICARLSPYSVAALEFVYQRGEVGGDVFVLLRGDLSVLDADQQTALFRIPEGTFFGEGTVLRALEGQARAKRTENVWAGAGGASLLRIAQEDMQVCVWLVWSGRLIIRGTAGVCVFFSWRCCRRRTHRQPPPPTPPHPTHT